MLPNDLMRVLVDALEGRRIPYMIVGSMATITYGDPRFTNDIDVVVILAANDVDALCDAFPAPEYYFPRNAASDAVIQHFQFNIIHNQSGLKIDVIVSDDTEFSRCQFARRVRVAAEDGSEAWFASPEDVIIKKLEYYKEGRSEKHIRDVAGVLKVKAGKIDYAYIEMWTERLQLSDVWQELKTRIGKS